MTYAMPRLTAVVATAGLWGDLQRVVDALEPAISAGDVDVIAVCAGDGSQPPPDRPGLRHLAVPESDLFAARVAGVVAATGDLIALLEDHSVPDCRWAAAVLDAWETHPEFDALVHPMATADGARAWEVALFTLTFGPFLGVTEVTQDRLPVPGQISFRRSLLPPTAPAPGWVEYELLLQLASGGRIAMTDATLAVHIQPVVWRAPWLSFHSGRTYAGSRLHWGESTRALELGRLRKEVVTMWQQTFAARRRMNGGAVGRRFRACAVVLISANVVGQLFGIALQRTGNSPAHLQ